MMRKKDPNREEEMAPSKQLKRQHHAQIKSRKNQRQGDISHNRKSAKLSKEVAIQDLIDEELEKICDKVKEVIDDAFHRVTQ
jgi:hypothetical protein